ncbi:hypothetical protein BDZ89DRAFT_1072679, partial [Hymenopellis radicata]
EASTRRLVPQSSVREVIRVLYCSQDFREVSVCSYSIGPLDWQRYPSRGQGQARD